MKNKFLVLAFLSFVVASGVMAQTSTSSTAAVNAAGFYIKGGVNLANISTSSDGSYRNANTLTTFNVGVIADLPLADVFSIQPGLVLTGKGSKANYYADDNNTENNFIKTKFNPLYLELPVNFVAKFPIAPGTKIFVGAGPYAALGIGGKTKVSTDIGGVVGSETSDNIKFGSSNDDDLKSFDYGLNGLAGVEISKFMIGVNYGLGLAKIFPNQDDNNSNDKNKYRVLSLNVGFKF